MELFVNPCHVEENCWDNAPQESFGHMKDELAPYIPSWKTFEDVKARIDDWMDYYNNDYTRHSSMECLQTSTINIIKTNELPPAFKLL